MPHTMKRLSGALIAVSVVASDILAVVLIKGAIEQPVTAAAIGMLLVAGFCMRLAYLRDH